MTKALDGVAVITGIGQTEFSKEAGRSETQLAAEAIVAALTDAGLDTGDVDGLVSYTIDGVEETELIRALGVQEIQFSSRIPYGGGGSQGVLLHAAAALTSGAADTVVVYRAVKARSGARFGRSAPSGRAVSSHSGSTAMQWCMPYGAITPASWFSLNATRYMHDYAVTSSDFGRAVVQLRDYAAMNPNAHFFERPITLEDHQNSRWIAEPCIKLFDCCQETDGAVAFVLTTRRRTGKESVDVVIATAAGAAVFEEEVASNHYRPDLGFMDSAASLGRHLFEEGGFSPSDLDVALVYDAFTPVLFMQIEALGLCPRGKANDFIAAGIGLDSALPINPNGGLIGEGYIHGLNLTLEAVRQLRGTAVNQVPDARTALVAAGRTGVILQAG